MIRQLLLAALFMCPVVMCPVAARAADWPQHRAGAARNAYTPEGLAPELALSWIYRSHVPAPAWPSAHRLDFDSAYQPVVAGGLLFFGSSADGAIRALDAATGEERWTFFTGAPVRLAPAAWKERVFAASDDGFLYCLEAASGRLLWAKRGGPSGRMVLGNDRVCSAWPARGGPAVHEDVVYWGAGIWPSEGIFIYAIDADTGKEIWLNDQDGFRHMPQPHGGAEAASGIAAQGHLAVHGERVFVPTGRAVPAALRRDSGALEYFHLQKYGQSGGSEVIGLGSLFHNGGVLYEATTGHELRKLPGAVARLGEEIVQVEGTRVTVHRAVEKERKDRKGESVRYLDLDVSWSAEEAAGDDAVICAGEAIVTAGGSRIAVVDAGARAVTWSAEVRGTVRALAAAGGRLYAATSEGFIYCFARAEGPREVAHPAAPRALPLHEEPWASAADAILEATGVRAGYCVDLGCGDGKLALELARQSDLKIYCVEEDAERVERVRQLFDRSGLYGVQVFVHRRSLGDTAYPAQLANLVVSGRSVEDVGPALDDPEIERLLRPWGGTVCLGPPDALQVRRRGPLPGAGAWTHQYSDPANTCSSGDTLAGGPLRMRWFRDADLVMPQRHGRAPAPLFRQGFLIVEGLHALRAMDAYNGRTLWEVPLPDVLRPYDQDHLMGTAGTGSNVCISGDSVYVHTQARCHRLSLASGEELGAFPVPPRPDGTPGTWGYLACLDGVLLGSIADTDHLVKWRYLRGDMQGMFSESTALFAMDAASGELLWRREAARSIRHNAIAAGAGRVFFIDREPALEDRLDFEKRRGEPEPPHPPGELIALDAATGEVVWRQDREVFGTMLALSAEANALLMSYQPTRFRLPSEKGGRMAVFDAASGERFWDREVAYASRPILNGATIYAEGGAWDLLAGTERPFPFARSYGCGILAASRDLMVFRSATLGYFDLGEGGKTRNYGGLRLGCWINAIPAGGLVLVPDGSGGCKCSYLNRASLALEPAGKD